MGVIWKFVVQVVAILRKLCIVWLYVLHSVTTVYNRTVCDMVISVHRCISKMQLHLSLRCILYFCTYFFKFRKNLLKDTDALNCILTRGIIKNPKIEVTFKLIILKHKYLDTYCFKIYFTEKFLPYHLVDPHPPHKSSHTREYFQLIHFFP